MSKSTRISFGADSTLGAFRSAQYPSEQGVFNSRLLSIAGMAGASLAIPYVSSPWMVLVLAAVAVSFALMLVAGMISPAYFLTGTIRIATDARPLRFVAHRVEYVFILALMVMLVLMGLGSAWLLWIAVAASPETISVADVPKFTLLLIAAGVAGVVLLVRSAVNIRTPLGLTLSEEGITAAWDGNVRFHSWDDLHRVTISQDKWVGPRLSTLDHSGKPRIRVSPRTFGSDPMLVAAIIHYFRDHPSERRLLQSPDKAVQQFVASRSNL